jgi:hypothetical protein
MAQATISKVDDRIALKTPYNPDFVSDLKSEINYADREWDRANKVWLVTEARADEAIQIVARYFDVIDGREKSADEIEGAQIEAEIKQIQANQAYILEREERIDEIISALDRVLSHYSPRSKSNIRYSIAQDCALLGHALDNARMDVAQMAELQVRGLSAAVRLLDSTKTPRYWPFGWNLGK